MPKPTDLAIWSTDANYPMDAAPEEGTPTKVAPVLGKQQLGYRPAEEPPATTDNWWRNVVHQWIEYIDAAVWDGDLTVDGNLTVTGDTTLEGDLIAEEDLTLTGSLEGAAGVPVLAGAGVEAPVYYHTVAQCLHISAGQFIDATRENSGTVTHVRNSGSWTLASSVTPITIPITLPLGAVITAYEINLTKLSGVGQTHFSQLRRTHEDGTESAVSAGHSNNANAPGAGTYMVETGINHAINTFYGYHITFTPAAGGGADQIGFCRLYWTMPAP